MHLKPQTLRGSVALVAFLLEAVLLLGAFVAIDLLLWRSIQSELRRTAGDELRWLRDFVVEHEGGGSDFLLEELEEHVGSRHGILLEIRRKGEPLFLSRELGSTDLPEVPGPFHGPDGTLYWVAAVPSGGYHFAVGVPAGNLYQVRRSLRRLMAVCLGAGLLVAAGLALLLAERATEPLSSVAEASERIHAGNLGERLPPSRRRYREVERLTASFNRMLERLDAAVGRLRQFTADASHELRTPLAVLKLQAQSELASGKLDAETAELLSSQLEEIDRLQSMVEDLLTLARLEAGSVDFSTVDLADLVIESVEQLRPVAETKGVTLSTGSIEPVQLQGEARPLRRVVMNLLDNGLKFTTRGGSVRVDLRLRDGKAELIVSDTGRGIPREELSRIFERFYRADASRSRKSGGAGLGLSIVERVVQSHHGTVSVESRPGRGSTFTVELPIS